MSLRFARSLVKQLSPENLEQLLAWYKVRDLLLGSYDIRQDIEAALALAAVCKHANAV
jgi:hypothetical protein